MKVKAITPIRHNGKRHEIEEVFIIKQTELEGISNLVEVIEEDKAPNGEEDKSS